jgi:hypothetical protein
MKRDPRRYGVPASVNGAAASEAARVAAVEAYLRDQLVLRNVRTLVHHGLVGATLDWASVDVCSVKMLLVGIVSTQSHSTGRVCSTSCCNAAMGIPPSTCCCLSA